ncbi:MAG: hypothetical protein U0263_42240 [Polyangiaceae bacterium]
MTLARSGAWWRALLTVAALGSWASNARAAGPLGPDGSPIATSNYRVDLSQGVVLGGNRVLGLAGAYVAIAEGIDGNSQNAAAPAVRTAYSFDHLDYDLGFGLTFPAAVRGNDLFNSGDKTTLSRNQKSALFIDIGGNLQIGRWGVGLTASYMQFQLAPQGQNLGLTSRFGGLRLQIARAFADGQLVLGVGSRGTGLVVERENPSGGSTQLFNIEGADAEFGTLWRPNDQPFRIGAAVRSAVITNDLTTDVPKDALGDRVLKVGSTNIFLPNAVALPWEISVGLALQVGRPFNPRWVDPDEALARLDRYLRWRELERKRAHERVLARPNSTQAERQAEDASASIDAAVDEVHRERLARAVREELVRRQRQLERFYVLVSSSLLVTGPVKDAVGVESFIERRVQRSGQKATFTPRLGVESEVVPRWLKLRAGSYGEPTRFSSRGARARLHGTVGFEQKLFPWTVFGLFDDGTEWRLSGALDGARRYLSWGVSLGVWR